jgi:hypothetical protein
MTRPEHELEITYWLLDTRTLWPGQKIAEAVGIHDMRCGTLADMLHRPPPSSNSSAPRSARHANGSTTLQMRA